MTHSTIVLAALLLTLTGWARSAVAPTTRAILDEQGRELIPSGFVTLTEDGKGHISYTPDDYRRMVRMGANCQVIRTALGRLGGWPGKPADPAYFDQLDAMVRMGREAGLKTVFKLVVYDVRPFGPEQWDALWRNTHGTQDAVLAACQQLWLRYQHEPSVFGYDLLNEPQCGLDADYERTCREGLLPTLRRLADAMHAVSPDKWALYQPLFMNQKDRLKGVNPFVPIKEPFGRDRVIYAPHLYHMDLAQMAATLDTYASEAKRSQAPLLIGEWGPATPLAVDTDVARQAVFTKVYQATANALDQRGVGAIKAWFCGTRAPLMSKVRPEPFTWAIFSDPDPVGHLERKYLTGALARPRPLLVAGHLDHYGYDFATRTLEVRIKPDPNLAGTEIFVPAERFYSAGFRVEVGSGLVLVMQPGEAQLRTVTFADEANHEQAGKVRWDAGSQHLIISKWLVTAPELTIKVGPVADLAPSPMNTRSNQPVEAPH